MTRLRGHHHGVKGVQWVEVVLTGIVYFISFSSPGQVAQEFWDWECIPWDLFFGWGKDRPEKTFENIFFLLSS